MKKIGNYCLTLLLALSLILSSCSGQGGCKKHKDNDGNGVCDLCYNSVFIYFDFYSVSNLSGVSEGMAAYLQNAGKTDENAVFLSSGNIWDGSVNTTEWMNEQGFAAMALGSSEYDLGIDYIEDNAKKAEFPLLAINIYDSKTDKLAEYCTPSTVVEGDGIKIGIIGASADADNSGDVYFKTGSELTSLVKAEAERLRKKGADFIVYLLHDGYSRSYGGAVQKVSETQLSSYYDAALSDGYVDLVFEGRTRQSYRLQDTHGVYHLQNIGDDDGGLSHVEIAFNTATDSSDVRVAELVSADTAEIPADTPADTPSDTSSSTASGMQTSSKPNDTESSSACKEHKDDDGNEICDLCFESVIVYFDFYSVNDLHGKLSDGDNHPGVDELTTYLKNAQKTDENAVLLSAGDMWQGTSESNMTKGIIMTDWMNELDFAAMAIGNHEYDWGEEYIEDNEEFAEFPFLAINIYDRKTNKLADYCAPSVMVEGDGLKIGIIGAIGDCYSSIAVDKCQDVYFKVGRELTTLVKNEADKLRANGADFIVYMLHDGYDQTYTGSVQSVTSSQISSYYDTSLSNGYVDLVFEGHTHQGYRLKDEYGVYHLQNRGDNKGGISHAEVAFNTVTDAWSVTAAELVPTSQYQDLEDDPIVEKLLEKYEDQISPANKVLGYNSRWRSGDSMRQLVADLYYETGIKEWSDKYDIVLGGGFISVRSPYNLPVGEVNYSDIQSLFPFDNQLTLCSVSGRNLRNKFFETSNSDYFICYGDYGETVKNNINLNATYYIVVDTYSAYYSPNGLTVVETYDDGVFARDLLADYIENGGLK